MKQGKYPVCQNKSFILCACLSHRASCCSLWRLHHPSSLCEGSWCGSWYFHPGTCGKKINEKLCQQFAIQVQQFLLLAVLRKVQHFVLFPDSNVYSICVSCSTRWRDDCEIYNRLLFYTLRSINLFHVELFPTDETAPVKLRDTVSETSETVDYLWTC